ncbi:MAG: type VI secretion system baseplate subunit TssE [Rhodospirillales bacterium]|nr:MAG: type VI secretion system baseplate subunit TssE [Rhodospirillales bacterium]
MPRPIRGARALLFERLSERGQDRAGEGPPGRVLDRTALRESVARELSDLLNTRVAVAADMIERRRRTVIDYGIPDFSVFPPRDSDAERRLADHIRRAILAFEPRLAEPQVTIERVPDRGEALVAAIAGQLAVGDVMETVFFQVPLSAGQDDAAPDAGLP